MTASRALIEAAIEAQADAIFVHHGLFWRGMDGRITGWLKERIRLLLAHDINLFAYHLPLDAHPQWGNNAQLGVQLGLEGQATFGEQNLGWMAAAEFADAAALGRHVEQALGRTPVCVGRAPHSPHSPHCMVHGRRARFLRGRDCRWGGCLHHGRDFRAAGAPGPGNGRGLSGGRPPCHGALWCADLAGRWH